MSDVEGKEVEGDGGEALDVMMERSETVDERYSDKAARAFAFL